MTFLAGLLCGGLAVAFLCVNQQRPPWSLQGSATPVVVASDDRAADGAFGARDDTPLLMQEEEKSDPVGVPAPTEPAVAEAPAVPVPELLPPAGVREIALPTAVTDVPRGLDLLMPVSGVQPADLSDTYTQSRSDGRSHEAIDIMAATGTPVVAVADGTIVKLFNSKQGGLTIYQFDIAGELAYYYAHLDRYADALAEGQDIKRGTLIGYVGFSGNANPAGPHLHFAIFVLGPEKNWWQGTPINPYPHLGGR